MNDLKFTEMEKIKNMKDLEFHVRVPAGVSKEEVLKALTEEVEREMEFEFESEDERIRKKLHEVICRSINDPNIPYKERDYISKSVLPYVEKLEKLKEQPMELLEPDKNVEKIIEDIIRVYGKTQGEWVGGYDIDTLIVNLRRAFEQKEQKPALRLVGDGLISDPNSHFELVGDQKPAEWSEDFEDNIRNLLHNKLTGHSEDGSMSWTTLIDNKTL